MIYSIRVLVDPYLQSPGPFRLYYNPHSAPIEQGDPDADGDRISDAQDPDQVAAVVADPSTSINTRNRNMFLERLDVAEAAIAAGDVPAAIDELRSLRTRVDGCGRKADKNDWVKDCGDQLAIRTAIDDVLAALSA